MKKIDLFILMLIASLGFFPGSGMAGQVNGSTFISSKYARLTVTAPRGWRLSDTEEGNPDGDLYPILELKRTKKVDGITITGKLQAMPKLSARDARRFARNYSNNLENMGFEITEEDKLTISGKTFYRVTALMRIGTRIEVKQLSVVMGGKKTLYMLSMGYRDRLEDEISSLLNGISFQ